MNDVVTNGWLDSADEVPDLKPCPKCDSLEQWESGGLNPRWRCIHCDPPTTANRLIEHAGRIILH
jgi:hypothetical protein